MQKISWTFNGTAAVVYLSLGFIPDEVTILALEDDKAAQVHWQRGMRAADINNGYLDTNGNTDYVLYTAGQAIEPYFGQDVMNSTNQTSTTYGEGVYLSQASMVGSNLNRAKSDTDIPAGDGLGATIDKWTLNTSGNRTGQFNADIVATGSWIQEGSRIVIDGKEYFIEAVAGGAGAAADEVTLSQAAPSGHVDWIGPSFDMIPTPLGRTTGAGIKLSLTSIINVNNETQLITAVNYDG